MFSSIARPGAGLFFIAVVLSTLLSASRTPITADAGVTFRAAELWLETGSTALQPNDFRGYNLVPSPDGKRYAKYPVLAFVACVPAAWFMRHFGNIADAPGWVVLALVPACWTALLALGLALLLARLGLRWRAAMGLACLVIAGSPLWIYARIYYGEISQAALLVWTLLAAHLATEDKRWAPLAGLTAGLAVAAKPTLLVVVPCVALALPLRLCAPYLLGLLPGALSVGAYNWLRYGSLLALGYGGGRDGTLGFATPLLVGLFGNFASPGKSVFLYAPLLLLSPFGLRVLIRDQRRFWLCAWAAPLLLLVLLVSKWWAWSGDMAWGPRLLVPLVPWMALPALLLWNRTARARRALCVLGALGVLLQLPALLLTEAPYLRHMWHVTRPAMSALASQPSQLADDIMLLHYVPWMSPLVAQAWLLWAKLRGLDAAGPPPWSYDGFDRVGAIPALPSWNVWFDGSAQAWPLAFALVVACAAVVTRLWQVSLADPR